MSINSSLIKLANKIDTDGVSEITPDYKNPNNSIEKSIERIADNYESGGGGGSSLPAVTPEDEGKVLTVDSEGEWVAGTGGGGGGVLICTLDMQTGALNKTWQEIFDAASVGSVILINNQTTAIYHGTLSYIRSDEGYEVAFRTFSDDNTTYFIAENATDYPVVDM